MLTWNSATDSTKRHDGRTAEGQDSVVQPVMKGPIGRSTWLPQLGGDTRKTVWSTVDLDRYRDAEDVDVGRNVSG